MMKQLSIAIFIAAIAFGFSGTATWACNSVSVTVNDTATGSEYADGGAAFVVDDTMANPATIIKAVDNQLSGGQFNLSVTGNIGTAKLVVSLYHAEGTSPIAPIVHDVTFNGVAGACTAIVDTVNSGSYLSVLPAGEGMPIAF